MSSTSTGLSSEERKNAILSKLPSSIDCIRTIRETAAIVGIGEPSLRVMIKEGRGPQVTRLSARRIGVKDSAREFWIKTLEAVGA